MKIRKRSEQFSKVLTTDGKTDEQRYTTMPVNWRIEMKKKKNFFIESLR